MDSITDWPVQVCDHGDNDHTYWICLLYTDDEEYKVKQVVQEGWDKPHI